MEIKVTFGALSQAQSDISSTANKIEGQLESLKSRLQPLVSTWEGDAAAAYNEHQRKWDEAAADLKQVLNQIGIAVGHALEQYQDAERKNASRWGA
ncbi:early secretory antigenic target ESAT-6 [Streptoalloteichus tenebrarius]|uniref:ESAT-6-like protein n=1 Tax=Streptoalloteichus tenebrarius (strain ATCC 17920 / DSM 40477 / JCM 4838 / CBS 697.72 / NBRC 16177 / NCIMB 11028 / NRRL B-12390 / A12253. 1 / ISP 5477) TaxID=1933 RepID=A0ABT1HXG2_STRSD|nr:WXG100 family type VII secretion target [Streptoalloteichus tenebrarius]MCP2260204.1 early secretory antigenic target ESAT-6 [Streptoalloteichus tenebrarius]BFF02594.1 hypothetical protein GCM10020241_42690 [Streptoalloteichus tenebrarius]